MEEEYILGKMGEDMKENINMIKSMVMAFMFGQMKGNMRVFGSMENSTVEENIYNKMELLKLVFGKMGKEYLGLILLILNMICSYNNNNLTQCKCKISNNITITPQAKNTLIKVMEMISMDHITLLLLIKTAEFSILQIINTMTTMIILTQVPINLI